MRRILSIVGLIGFLAVGAFAQVKTADSTVFGLRLSERFSLPECTHLKKSELYLGNDTVVCFERLIASSEKGKWKSPIVDETVTIRFPFGRGPALSSSDRISGQIVDGNLESIGFNTLGLTVQGATLGALKAKYGEPTKTAEETKQNALGATFDSQVAVWEFENLTVIFQGMTDRIDSGLVNVDTKKGSEYRARLLKNSQKRPAL